MTTRLPNLCLACSRFDAERGDACTSFPGPDGIPRDILVHGGDHRVSRAGELPFDHAGGAAADDEFAAWLSWHDSMTGGNGA